MLFVFVMRCSVTCQGCAGVPYTLLHFFTILLKKKNTNAALKPKRQGEKIKRELIYNEL